jgi:heme exporter protein C
MRAAPTMATTMLLGMLIMTLALWAYTLAVVLLRLRCIILERERDAAWIATLEVSR